MKRDHTTDRRAALRTAGYIATGCPSRPRQWERRGTSAVRLEDVAAPGQIICSAATHRLIRGQFQCASLGHRKIKGVAQPVELFQVQGVGEPAAPSRRAGPAGLTPLTGRDHEISLLKDRWEQAQEGMGQVVLSSASRAWASRAWCTR